MSNHEHTTNTQSTDAAAPSEVPAHGYWMSLAELAQGHPTNQSTDEFPADEQGADPLSRRNFFHLMGASMALAGVAGAGCKRYEAEHIVPLARRPEDQTPGVTQQYASAFELGGVAQPLLVTSFEGRPIHVDGNPEHPFAGTRQKTRINETIHRHAGSSTFAQASVLGLYDPDRDPANSKTLPAGKGLTVDQLSAWWAQAQKSGAGAIRVLAEATSSPTVRSLRADLAFEWHEYEALSWDNERAGTKAAFGRPLRPFAHLEKCHTIVSLDADIFGDHPAGLRYAKDFGQSRRPDGTLGGSKINRVWSAESAFTSTGAMADHRLPLRSELILPLAMALDAELGGGSQVPAAEFLKEAAVAPWLTHLVAELRENNGRAVVFAGRRQPPAVHALVARINASIGAVGNTLDYIEDADATRLDHLDSIKKLVSDINGGQVKHLVIIGGNPVYDAPADLDFAAALAKVDAVHVAEFANETSVACKSFMPKSHYLECWSDSRTFDGTVTIAQPLIAPLYGSISTVELVAMMAGKNKPVEELIGGSNPNWKQAVHDGFVAGTALPLAKVAAPNVAAPQLAPSQLTGTVRKNGELEVTFVLSSASYDGRFANNPWLQETPDFLTKVTWDNYALVGPATANDLGIANESIITVTVPGGKPVDIAAYVMPGQARGSIGLVVGGGRTKAGVVGGLDKKTVGFNVYPARTVAGFNIGTGVKVSATGRSYPLASTQEHWDMRAGIKQDIGRDEIAKRNPILVKETTMSLFAADHTWHAEPRSEYHVDGNRGLSLFEEHDYKGHRWAMSIDLGNCIGCNSCMVACQSENNIPVVGKKEVMNNREMSWIRIDRYFSGSMDSPAIVHQPVGCQHCEMAPCEQVCPVGATVHSDEGLNEMAYNRCVGTRYCLNNCPYRVRRFNFLNYHQEFDQARAKVRQLVFNPDVTVRERGVMEKCSFCVQRIQNAKINHKAAIRQGMVAGTPADIQGPMADGTVVTACQAACPTEAIVFGDLMDPNSRVAQLHGDRRSYDLLPESYTKPRNKFMARVRNPHPALASKPAASHSMHNTKEGGH